ncbi:hypothetical protein SAMN05216289_11538 [Dokdonella immobilis]|uniref:Extracellular repeat, HAF family n=2 Tax=Dokdonella immobilis TaxID=578942 RepID=A0A1I4Y652_9GAMM|nr:hypothetical protein SAMN05216289_11538 [Dokdonella immobilis]
MFVKASVGAWIRGLASLVLIGGAAAASAQQVDIPGPAGSVDFGASVALLPNGNFVVIDPTGGASGAGRVYLYSPTGNQISVYSGSNSDDLVGSTITVLANGNFVVSSPNWRNGANAAAGAVTWVSGGTGMSGAVSAANSLIGSSADDNVGSGGVILLSNGNFVVSSPEWDNGFNTNAGAVTWVNAETGLSGEVSAANSLVGTQANDRIGYRSGYLAVTALTNSNYVVSSPFWDNGTIVDAGAATWANGSTGLSGEVSQTNSLVGTTPQDYVGGNGVTPLSNGNYVVSSTAWDNGASTDAGAATWANGTVGISGAVSAANSLVGSSTNDRVSYNYDGITALDSGHFLVKSPFWSNGAVANVGAVTWVNGSTGLVGEISEVNSLIGTQAGDSVGGSVTMLSNGHYVVSSPNWHNGAIVNGGAVTWANGTTGLVGHVSVANSLVGTIEDSFVGSGGVTALSNGHCVVKSPNWDDGANLDVGAVTWANGNTGLIGVVTAANSLTGTSSEDMVGTDVIGLNNGNYVVRSDGWGSGAGAVTWANGNTGLSGHVSVANSLVGTLAGDRIGNNVTPLINGNYVITSPYWHNGASANAGAVTWANGSSGLSGEVSSANSLVGVNTDDHVGSLGVKPLSNGNYVVSSPEWSNGAIVLAGAVSWANGNTGLSGEVSAANSLIGTQAGDAIGWGGVFALGNGNYLVASSLWNNGAIEMAGAVSMGRGSVGLSGPISAQNSVRGMEAQGGQKMVQVYDAARDTLIVGQPAANLVSLFRTDLLFKNGFDQDGD